MFNKCCPSPAKSEHIKFVNLLRHKKHVKNITYVASKEQIFLLITCTLHIQIPKFTIIIKVSKKCVTSLSVIIFYNKNKANSFEFFFFFIKNHTRTQSSVYNISIPEEIDSKIVDNKS